MNTGVVSRSNSVPAKDISAIRGEYSGWLKKLGGKFKTWRKRFFVLRGTKLSYYTSQDELRLLGEFSLEYTEVEALNGESESNGDKGYLFVVKPEDPSALLTPTHQQFLLSASSPDERKSWMRAIRKALYLKRGGALFGTHLSEAFPFTKPEHGYHPRVVHDTTQFIRRYGLETEGVFRKCGTQHSLQELAEAYDVAAPDPILIPEEHNVHVVAGLLKYYLRELPEPLIPFQFYDQLKSTGFRIVDGQDLTPIIDILEALPAPNYHLLQFLCQFLYEVAQHESTNRMSIENLASVFAPNFLRPADGDLDMEMAASNILNLLVAELIRQNDHLFRLELVSLKQLQSVSQSRTYRPRLPRRRSRKSRTVDHIVLNKGDNKADRFDVGYPDVIDPAFKVDKTLAMSDREGSTRSLTNSQGSFYDNRSLKLDEQNISVDKSDHVSVSKAPMQNRIAPPNLVNSLNLYTPRSERSCLRRKTTHTTAAGDYEFEDGYSTPTTATRSSEVINLVGGCSSDSMKLLSQGKHLQSSGFISCFDCPTNPSLSIGTQSPQSSTKLSGYEQLDQTTTIPSTWSPPDRYRMHHAARNYKGHPSALRRQSSLASQNQANREQDDIAIIPKPPPFTVACSDSRLILQSDSPICSPHVIRSTSQQQQTHTNIAPTNTTATTNFGVWHSNYPHEFDTPERLQLDDQIRYWRALAVSSRADAASQRARTHSLTGELTRTQCDLEMAKLEIRLLRQQLAAAETELNHHYQLGLVPALKRTVWTEIWNTR